MSDLPIIPIAATIGVVGLIMLATHSTFSDPVISDADPNLWDVPGTFVPPNTEGRRRALDHRDPPVDIILGAPANYTSNSPAGPSDELIAYFNTLPNVDPTKSYSYYGSQGLIVWADPWTTQHKVVTVQQASELARLGG